ncbi:hypothetical protein V8J36_01175 [Frigidibacter sp. MR17.14]|uniref:DUF6976 family protein n=1 Tax=Frigidibacter sp. MR17.14 TaxID=3126509 RepID=UPI003012B38B
MRNEMLSPAEAAAKIEAGAVMVIAGDEALLRALPRGKWIGGTSVYFVTEAGGCVDRERLFCTTFDSATDAKVRHLDVETLPAIAEGYLSNGVTFIMLPAFSLAHSEFAVAGSGFPGLFDQPLVGWVTGVHLDEIGKRSPLVIDGATGAAQDEGAVLLHVALPDSKTINLDILNIFSQGDAAEDSFLFDTDGFSATTVKVNGVERRFAEYITETGLDPQLPLVANYAGALINVSIQSVDQATGEVKFYAPVVHGVEYRQARPVGNYVEAFAAGAGSAGEGEFSCNCILNYLYGGLEGHKTGGYTGPVTFGEIAYILLNQTMVHLDVAEAEARAVA